MLKFQILAKLALTQDHCERLKALKVEKKLVVNTLEDTIRSKKIRREELEIPVREGYEREISEIEERIDNVIEDVEESRGVREGLQDNISETENEVSDLVREIGTRKIKYEKIRREPSISKRQAYILADAIEKAKNDIWENDVELGRSKKELEEELVGMVMIVGGGGCCCW